MKIASAFSTASDTKKALQDAYADLQNSLGGPPTWMAVHTSYEHPGEIVTATLRRLAPGVPFQGGTSCLGVMTEVGFHSEQGVGLGLFGILDPAGSYEVGYAAHTVDSRTTGREAIRQALHKAGPHRPPALIWMACVPGDEEEIIAGIEGELTGMATPIIGGSTADRDLKGDWYQLTNDQVLYDGVVVTAMYPSRPIHYAFDSSYTPTAYEGIITQASGRIVHSINHRPAAEVYNEWTAGAIDGYLDGGNIFARSALHPIGRTAVLAQGMTLYQISHPEAVVENRALALFTEAEAGVEITLMEGSTQELVERVDRITSHALAGMTDPVEQIAGALIIYCAGCMLAVQNDMEGVVDRFRQDLRGQPFLGLFTFGEQGCSVLGENVHANLMMSIIVFER